MPKNKITVFSYVKPEKWTLLIITVSGILYNVGMTAGPWFEGKLAQYLCDIIGGTKEPEDMVRLSVLYVVVIFTVQAARFIKRLYVRKFGNNINREMKENIYHSMLGKSQVQLEEEGLGSLMTKAVSDVDACVEGIRKFTTEIFDTGVVMVSYLVMLLVYDWRLTLLSMIFPPVAYVIADKMKRVVTKSAQAYKESAGNLNAATYDRVGNAVTYRIYGQETTRDSVYETGLLDYERKAVMANIWENSLQPVYQVISMMGAVCILWLGGRNVLGQGWKAWDIAAFVTFLSCFAKLAAKSSKAAKLFNAVQKAQVSWKRIHPLLEEDETRGEKQRNSVPESEYKKKEEKNHKHSSLVSVRNLSFHYPEGPEIFSDVSFHACRGEIIGVTGPVACGKSTLGKLFLGGMKYEGEISLNGSAVYMGHEPELISGTIEENILLGSREDVWEALSWVCMDKEIREMPEGIHTRIGNGGVTLSGGQQARIALARTLVHRKKLLILDDPFSAVDMKTEQNIFSNIRRLCGESAVMIFSHRLSLFPKMEQVFWMEEGKVLTSTHEKLLLSTPLYAHLYETQKEGADRTEGGVHSEA